MASKQEIEVLKWKVGEAKGIQKVQYAPAGLPQVPNTGKGQFKSKPLDIHPVEMHNMTGKMSKATPSRTYDQGNGGGYSIKCCITCGADIHQTEPRRTTPGNCAAWSSRNVETCKACPHYGMGWKACIGCKTAKWLLPIGKTRVEGGSKRGSVGKHQKTSGFGSYVLPDKSSEWVVVNGPCQQVFLARDAEKNWTHCRKCYADILRSQAALVKSSPSIIVQPKNPMEKPRMVVPDHVLRSKSLQAIAKLNSMGLSETKTRKRSGTKPETPSQVTTQVVKTYRFTATMIVRGVPGKYITEARTSAEAREDLLRQTGLSKFTSTLFKENDNGDLIRQM